LYSNWSNKIIKKTLKIGLPIVGTVVVLLFSSWLILQSPVVQTYLTQKLAAKLSGQFNAKISVRGVSIRFFDKIILKDVLIEDQKHDSLLFVHELAASIDSFSIKKRYVSIHELKLEKTLLNVNTNADGKPNYQFLLDAFSRKDTTATDSLRFGFIMNKFDFNDARIRYVYRDTTGLRKISLDDISLNISDVKLVDENVAFRINNFKLNDQKEFILDDFYAGFLATPDSVIISQLHAKTRNSEITEANIAVDKSKLGPNLDFKKLKVNLDLKKSIVSLKDVGLLVPALKGMDENIEVSGQVSGTLADIKGKNIALSLGNNTRLAFDVYLNGLPDVTNAYVHIDLKQSFADLNDLSRVKLPDDFPLTQLKIPSSLLQAGIIEYNGNFTGFLSDFVAYGTFKSKWGVLTTDLSFVPSAGEKLKINGRVKTVNFQLSELVQSDILDRITFNGDVKGLFNQKSHDFSASVSGRIDSLTMNNYQYKNIDLTGDMLNKQFNGRLVIDDPNLKFNFDGAFDLNVPVPVFNFNMYVEKANLRALKLVDSFKESAVSFAMNANFTGNNIDNLAGSIHFKEGVYQNENGLVSFNNFDLKTFNESEPVLQVRSDFLDADIRGQYQLHNLHNSVLKIISNYLPSAGLTYSEQKNMNNFDFRLNLKDINRFTHALMPDLKIEPGEIEGSINSEKNTLTVKALFPEIKYQSAVFHKLTISLNGDSKLHMRNKVTEIDVGDQFKVHNFSLISEAEDDVLDSKMAWNNYDAVSFSGSINTSTRFYKQKRRPHVEIAVKPTRLYLADSLWFLNSALISVDSSLIRINKLRLSNKSQSITADGAISRNENDKLNLIFNQVDLRSLNRLLGDELEMKGELDGVLSVFDVYRQALYLADLKVGDLGLLGQPIGSASIQSRWDRDSSEIVGDLLVKSEQRELLHANGIYNPGKDSLSVFTNFDHFSILILQPLMGSSFANFHGDATGKVWIHGPSGHIMHDGALYASNAGLMLTDLQANYTLNDSVRFSRDKIIFPDITIHDDFGNTGVFSGSIQHRTFSKMIYDMTIKTEKGGKILAINTTPQINEQFYGKLYGSGIVRITGKGAQVLISGAARTEKGTEMNISLEYEDDAQEYDFLNFVAHGYQPKAPVLKYLDSGDVQMKFDIEVTPDAKAQLIYNSKIGDVIRSQGTGNLQVSIDNDYNISLFGEYTVAQGDYLFTLQNVVNKKFDIQQGGTIEWNGDPEVATINLNAIYKLKASLSELFATTIQENSAYSQRIPVLCKINLTKNLSNPEIKFGLELPTTEDRIRDEVGQYISSEEDMNKQILSLLVLGKFYTPEYLRGTYAGTNNNVVGSTASELFSNQLSNWLSKISNDFDIGVNYRPGNQITNDEIELALSTQMFNDRVSINGNIGNNSAQRTSANNNGFVGDADVNVKITNNGKLQLKAYNHANNNLIYETSPYTQGVGLSYREDFNDFNELWQKVKSIFKKKNSRPSVTKPD
jgi:hypothetical protein